VTPASLPVLTDQEKKVTERTAALIIDSSPLSWAVPSGPLPPKAYVLVALEIYADGTAHNVKVRDTNLDTTAYSFFIAKCISGVRKIRFSKRAAAVPEPGLIVLRFDVPSGSRK
jgi:hypothetical protein